MALQAMLIYWLRISLDKYDTNIGYFLAICNIFACKKYNVLSSKSTVTFNFNLTLNNYVTVCYNC